jgi:hypothetical protein
MAVDTKEAIKKARSMAKGNTFGEMEAITKEAGKTIRLQGMASTSGRTGESI